MTTLKIGQLARVANVNIDTIRYYERQGLLPEPIRQDSGYRQYSQDDVKQLRFIKRAQKLGFSLREIKELLALRVDSDTVCQDVQRRSTAKVEDIEQKIASLRQIQHALEELMARCTAEESADACVFLQILDSEEALFDNKGEGKS
jgi:Hg(II)-responsive transcriptional regulator